MSLGATRPIVIARAIRGFADGFASVLLARYLLELGHERFGVVSQRLAGTGDGVAKALEGTAASLVVAESPRDGDPNGARAAVKQLLDARPAPSAIVCGSDEEALTAVRECSIAPLIAWIS